MSRRNADLCHSGKSGYHSLIMLLINHKQHATVHWRHDHRLEATLDWKNRAIRELRENVKLPSNTTGVTLGALVATQSYLIGWEVAGEVGSIAVLWFGTNLEHNIPISSLIHRPGCQEDSAFCRLNSLSWSKEASLKLVLPITGLSPVTQN